MKFKNLLYRDRVWAFILLMPNFIVFLMFVLIPLVASFFFSFTEWDLMTPMQWVGFANYIELFKDETFLKSLWNTIYFTLGTVPVGIIISLFLAIALNQRIKGIKIFRAAYFLPVIASFVAAALVWSWIYNPEFGLLNYFLSIIGIKGPSWLNSLNWAMPSIILTTIWKGLGFNMLLFLAGLQGIPESYYEAADIDGAKWFSKFLHITVPLLSNTTLFVVIISIINSFQGFDLVYMMTYGGPARSTSVLVFYLYQNAFKYFRMGYASAIAYVLFFLILFFALIQFWLQKKRVMF
ncbi:MAG: sugar ABC transporter permease [Actinobacteria bacterium]|nr:sugar ABC transporter permease [Actinomycetota bacterium]